MNEIHKGQLKWGVEVLLLFLGAILGITSSVACFNYATMDKSEGFFWLVGLANIIFWGVNIFYRARKIYKGE